MYNHTQFGAVTTISLSVAAILAGAIVYDTMSWIGVLVGVILVMTVALFASLTVKVDREAVRIRFGIGVIRKTFVTREIESVRVVRNSWLYGWGIRYTPHGWLYNVSGLGAVELQMRSGKKMRIGSDEPERLARAIERTLNAKR